MSKILVTLRENGGGLEAWNPVTTDWVVIAQQISVLSGFTPSSDVVHIPIVFDDVLEVFQIWDVTVTDWRNLAVPVTSEAFDYQKAWAGGLGTSYVGSSLDIGAGTLALLGSTTGKADGNGLLEFPAASAASFSGYVFDAGQQDISLECDVRFKADDSSSAALVFRVVDNANFHYASIQFNGATKTLRIGRRNAGVNTVIGNLVLSGTMDLNKSYKLFVQIVGDVMTARMHTNEGSEVLAGFNVSSANNTEPAVGLLWFNSKSAQFGTLKGLNL